MLSENFAGSASPIAASSVLITVLAFTKVNDKKTIITEDKTIFNFIKNNIKNINMIDIGVGGGRTTSFFLDIVDKYIGIDYSCNMIKKCKTRFKDVNFLQMDARNIKFNDNSFNFVLFSHNAIDYFNQDNRIKILSEMYRICENNGYVCFSSHNLYSYNKNLI